MTPVEAAHFRARRAGGKRPARPVRPAIPSRSGAGAGLAGRRCPSPAGGAAACGHCTCPAQAA
jgi:hypothetical protein